MSPRSRFRKAPCYACGSASTSREHVPARCFFPPKSSGGGGKGHRFNLVTVPSCDKHNSKKSADDFFLLFVISSHFENNSLARRQFHNSVIPEVKKRPAFLSFLSEGFPATIGGLPTMAFTVDRSRFDAALDHVARGIYYHHCRVPLSRQLQIQTPDLFAVKELGASRTNRLMQELDARAQATLEGSPVNGQNPRVFRYQFIADAVGPRFAVRMVFFEGFVVIAATPPGEGPS